jgi:hypothetical protein
MPSFPKLFPHRDRPTRPHEIISIGSDVEGRRNDTSSDWRALDRPARRDYAQIADRQWRFLDFWGPVSNFGIPIAAVMDTQKDAEMYVLIP